MHYLSLIIIAVVINTTDVNNALFLFTPNHHAKSVMKDEFFFPYDASWKSRLQSQKLQGNIAPHHVSEHKPRCPSDVNGYRLDASLASLLRSTMFLLPLFWSQLDFRERKKASHSEGSAELEGVAQGSITDMKKESPRISTGQTAKKSVNQSIDQWSIDQSINQTTKTINRNDKI